MDYLIEYAEFLIDMKMLIITGEFLFFLFYAVM